MKALAFSFISTSRVWPILLGCGCFLLSSVATAEVRMDQNDLLVNLEEEVTFLEGAMHRLEEEYQEIPDATKPAKVRQYLMLAKEAFQIKDYEKCSLAIYSIINSEKLEKSGKGALALHWLAESVYQLQNYTTALHYFKKMLKEEDTTYLHHAASRVIEIGFKSNKMKTVTKFFDRYSRKIGNKVPDQVRYERGRTLFMSEADSEALKHLDMIPKTSPYYTRAAYIAGAVKIRAEKYDEAIEIFRAITTVVPSTDIDQQLIELSFMGLGRLYYDRDMLDEAVNAYQFINFDSPFFSEMLYEVTWVYVRRGQLIKMKDSSEEMPASEIERLVNEEYKKALEQLRMLVELEADSRRTPDAYVLMGNLRLQRGEFDEAEQLFEKVVQRYEPTYDALKKLSQKALNPKKLLDDILAVQQGGLITDSQLPPLAATWTSEKDDITHVLATFRDLQISEQQMKSSLQLVEKLDRILTRDHPEEFFVTLRDGVQRAREIEQRLLALEKAKLSLMTEELTGGMGTGGKAVIVFKNALGDGYTLQKASFYLDGESVVPKVPLGELGNGETGTVLIEGPLAIGSHRLQVTLNFEGDGGIFDYVKSYRFNMKDELAFVSKGSQESKVIIEAYKRGDFTTSFEKRPNLRFEGDYSQGVALNLSAGDLQKLEKLRKEREILENKLAMIDNMGTGIEKSKEQTEKYISNMDRLLHEVKIAVGDAKAQLRALDKLLTDSTFIRKRTKEDLVILRKRLASLKTMVGSYERTTHQYQDQLDEAREEMVLSAMGGASKELIQKAYEHAVAKETAMLNKIESSGSVTSGYKAVRRLREQVKKLKKRNRTLQKRLSGAVTRQVKTMRAIVNKEKRKLAKYQKRVAKMNKKASNTAQDAVQLALGHVIDDFDNIIVRADIGLADTSFQKKQVHTREIGKLQQAKSEELSNLNQIYMDLQGDEVQ